MTNNITRLHCNRCNRSTNHAIERHLDVPWEDYFDDDKCINGHDGYSIARCMGCDAITFRHASWFSEDQDDNGSPIRRELMYPPRIARSKPDWLGAVLQSPFWTGETTVEQFLKEIYTSLDNSCPRLAAMGIRALIEYIIIDKCGDHGNFTRNLEEFRSSGHISPNQAKQIAAVIEMGHAATHRVFQPSVDDLKTSMDIVETIIADMYIHPERATKLASSIPTRKK